MSLRGLIDRAKKDQVPTHVIDKALNKATSGAGENYEPALYEGMGPGGCMVLIGCLTDNGNRTFGDIRGVFTKCKAKLGGQGSVSHMFDHRAMFVFAGDDEEESLEALMEADVDVSDIDCEDGMIQVLTPPNEFFKTKTALTDMNADIDFATMTANLTLAINSILVVATAGTALPISASSVLAIAAVEVGTNCRLCERINCSDRHEAPLTKPMPSITLPPAMLVSGLLSSTR